MVRAEFSAGTEPFSAWRRLVTPSLVPLVVIVVVLATDLWVYVDASSSARRGSPVCLRIATITVETPAAWFLACLVLWIFFFPAYVLGRSRS